MEKTESRRERETKRHAILQGASFSVPSPEEHLEKHVNQLIRYLYVPHDSLGWVANRELIDGLGFGNEPINYGDLKCVDVLERVDGTFEVTIDEADPECPKFCEWVRGWLEKWGWSVEVRTEW